MRIPVGLIFFILLWHNSFSQSNVTVPLVANRPGVSESPGLVIPGALQIETGSTLRTNKSGNVEYADYVFNTISLRYGINERLELRIKNDYIGNKEMIGVTKISDQGFAPLSLGLSIQLTDQKGIIPEIYFIPNIHLKSGSSQYKPAYTSADMTISMGHELNNMFYLTNHIGVGWDGITPETTLSYMLCLDVTLNNRTFVFIESYNYFVEHGKNTYNWDAGIYYRITPRFQVDMSVGTGLNKIADDFFLDGGFTIRLIK